jgi:eukaryotic-like serine/threonine-protein kinase
MLKPTQDAPETMRALAAASTSSSMDHRPGDVLADKYLLMRPLGMGGMGQVWVARNLATNAEVAAKVLLPERAVVGDALDRFRIEAQVTASLSHRGIVRAFDLVELDPAKGSLLLVMELLQGQSLGQRLEQAGRLPVAEALRVILPILSALDHAHQVGVVHRDLKPDNVFLATDPDGHLTPKLLDFGISKMRHASGAITARGALVGTPFYMSPEQARGDAVDGRSDLFGVGILLYECLSGAPPFGGQTLHDVVRSVLEAEPAPLYDAPEALREVVMRALAKRPEDRYATAAILAEAIVAAVPEAASAIVTSSAPPPSASLTSVPPAVARTTTGQRPQRSSRALLAWGATAIALVAAAGSLRGTIDRAAPMTSAPSAGRAPVMIKRISQGADVLAPPAIAEPVLPLAPSPPPTHRHRPPKAAPTPIPASPPESLVHDPGF